MTGATGRQRISPQKLLSLHVVVPPRQLQDEIGRVVEAEFALRALAAEKTVQADEEAVLVLGGTTLRI